MIQFKNWKWHSKLATQKPFICRDWREFWSDPNFSLKQINIPHYLSKEHKSQTPHHKSRKNEAVNINEKEWEYAIENRQGMERKDLTKQSWIHQQKRDRALSAAAVKVAAAVDKYKKIGQGKDNPQHNESMAMRTCWKMMNATDKLRNRNKSNLTDNNKSRANNNLNHINHKCKKTQNPQCNTLHMYISPRLQQYSPSPSLEEKGAIFNLIFPGDPRGHKEREPERKQTKPQQYAGLMEVVEKFHEIKKLIIEEKWKKLKVMFPGQFKEYPNKDGPLFFYSPKNYRPTPIPRPKDLNLSEEQLNQFDGDAREGVVPFYLQISDDPQNWAKLPKGQYVPGLLIIDDGVSGLINEHPRNNQSISETTIGLILYAVEIIIEQSEAESQNQEKLTNDLERIEVDGSDVNGNEEQTVNAIEPKHFINGNDRFKRNDSGTQLHATVNGEANPKINITKTPASTTFHNVNRTDGLGRNSYDTKLQAQPTKLDTQTIAQSITLVMKTITSKRMIIESKKMQTNKDLEMNTNTSKKLNIKTMETFNLKGQYHFIQLIPNKNLEFKTFHNPKISQTQQPNFQNQAKLK
ncbi:MAG: hypothetical protein EZS28_021870 [Streblomastix strix]|uniref:Uncharacterized protein n=1 Tax=Streblomastix strix TaxID=222440 RepID=A0A5J4VJ39_9EUKA|nr:MAG: hypothetical protein EZS28_021870 [Streblomastix strix]